MWESGASRQNLGVSITPVYLTVHIKSCGFLEKSIPKANSVPHYSGNVLCNHKYYPMHQETGPCVCALDTRYSGLRILATCLEYQLAT